VKRHRHTPEQAVRKVREGERLLNDGKDLAEILRTLEISEATWNRWRAQYGGMKATQAKRLRELEAENARLKKLVANQALDIDMLRSWPRETSDPERRRRAVGHLQARFGVSQRRACRVAGQHRTTQRRPVGCARTRRRGCERACAASPASIPGGVADGLAGAPPRAGRAMAGHQPQAHPAAVARGGPAPPGPDPQTPPGRSRAGRAAKSRAAQSGLGDRLPVRRDRRRAQAEAGQHRRGAHPRSSRHARGPHLHRR